MHLLQPVFSCQIGKPRFVFSRGVLANALSGKPCIPCTSDVKVYAESTNHYYYPDAFVLCGKPAYDGERKDIVKNPTLIIEVLSDSTEYYDRGEKFFNYRTIPSLREYVLISQHLPRIETFYKNSQGIWQLADASGLESNIWLQSLEIEMPLADIYRNIDFAESKKA